MQLRVKRSDPAGSQMAFVKVADATDVSTHSGSGLQLGEVFLRHAQINGPVPVVEGQTIRQDHYDHMLQVTSNAGNVDLYCWHSLAGQGTNAAIRVTSDRRGGVKAEYTEFGALLTK